MTTADSLIPTPHGKIFSRLWQPSTPTTQTTILLFHDSLGCVELWRDFPQLLATTTNLRVIAYDRLGFGRSDAIHTPLPQTFVRDEAKIIPHIIAHHHLANLILFGHSTGGSMAAATAAHLPKISTALITVSAQSYLEEHTLHGVRTGQREFSKPDLFARLVKYHGTKARWVLDSWVNTWLSPARANWNLDEELRAVHCPTLAIHGDRDEYGSVEHAHRIARLTAGPSQTLILKDCAHFPHREHPTQLLTAVTQFLSAAQPSKLSGCPTSRF